MTTRNNRYRTPAIAVARSDYERLTRLAESFAHSAAEIAERLLVELDRARVVPDAKLADDVVRMGSTLRFTTDAGEDRTVTLVLPGEADIAEGKISVLTPIGAALIGLSAGQSINWAARDGRTHRLTVEHVEKPRARAAETATAELRPRS